MINTPELNKALAAVQSELPETKKTEKANAGQYSYTYAGLPDILSKTLPILSKHGLSWSALPTLNEDGHFVLAYSLRHESGEALEGAYPLPTNGTPQQMGSAQTYARRYTFCAVVGIAADEDDDGKAAESASYSRPKARPKTVDRSGYITEALEDEADRELLKKEWPFHFPAKAVPVDEELDFKRTIDSYVGRAAALSAGATG